MVTEHKNRLGDTRGLSPASLKNLRPFKPGENGDPSKNGVSLTQELKIKLRKSPELRALLVGAIIDGAIAREPTPFKELWDRHDGKVPGDNVAINFNEIKILVVRESPPLAVTVYEDSDGS